VAVVQGKALGGGFEMALLSDIVLCSEKAQFGLPEITLGLIPGMGGTQVLPRIVGEKVAKRMIMSGLPIDAREAHRLNIAHLLPTEGFEQAVADLVSAIAGKSGEALIAANRAVKISSETTLDQGLDHEASIFQTLFSKKGAKEGITAFIEKRKPNFKGI
jgi:enoyl-CoA hydratase/carnithine racemase